MLWTRLWCPFCAEMACPAEVRISSRCGIAGSTRPQRAHAPAKSARARIELTYREITREGGRARLVVIAGEVGAGGRRRLRTSFALWLKQRPGRRHLCCKAKCAARGCADGAKSWRALQQRHSLCRCSTLVSQQVRMGTRPQRSKCCATAATTFEWQREGLVH